MILFLSFWPLLTNLICNLCGGVSKFNRTANRVKVQNLRGTFFIIRCHGNFNPVILLPHSGGRHNQDTRAGFIAGEFVPLHQQDAKPLLSQYLCGGASSGASADNYYIVHLQTSFS